MSTNRASLGGIPLEMDGSTEWNLTRGVAPNLQNFQVHESVAAQLIGMAGRPVTLQISDSSGKGKDLVFENLRILATFRGTHPNSRFVTVADRRILLADRLVKKDFNLRRNSAQLQFVDGNENQLDLAPKETWLPSSLLNEETPYDSVSALEAILGELGLLRGRDFVFDSRLRPTTIEEIRIDDNGDAAIARLLQEFPGVSLYAHPDGKLHFYDMEGPTASRVKRAFHFPGFANAADVPLTADRRGERAREVHVYFTRRIEAGFSGKSGGTSSSELRTVTEVSSEPFDLINVQRSTDRTLTGFKTLLNPEETQQEVTLVQGSWGEIGKITSGNTQGLGFLEAWRNDSSNPFQLAVDSGLGALSNEIIRRHYTSGLGYIWEYYTQAGAEKNVVWSARIQRLLRHWRLTWAIQPSVWNKISSFSPVRVAVSNRSLGRGAKSPVYMDYTLRPGRLGIIRGKADVIGDLVNGSIVKAGEAIASGSPAPVEVLPLDTQAGVFTLNVIPDKTGEWDQLVPGIPIGNLLPVKKLSEFNRNPRSTIAMWNQITLQENFEFQTILTVTPATPNDLRKFHKEIVTPSDVRPVLGRDTGPTNGGPAFEIRIFPGIMTADYAWPDNEGGTHVRKALAGAEMPENLMVNPETVRNIALAVAAAYYDSLLDRVEARGAEHELDGDRILEGSISNVTHRMSREGVTTTMITASRQPKVRSWWRFLSDSARRNILRALPREGETPFNIGIG